MFSRIPPLIILQQAQDQQHLPEDQVIDKQTVGSGMADENAGQQQTPVSSESPETASIITDNDEDDGDDSDLHQCLYHPLELQTASRKRSQIVMLERYVRLLKARFNDVFDEVLLPFFPNIYFYIPFCSCFIELLIKKEREADRSMLYIYLVYCTIVSL